MAAIPEVFALLWENTGELSDGCLIQALVKALGKSRCSYFADTQLPLGSEIRLFTLHCVDTFSLTWGVSMLLTCVDTCISKLYMYKSRLSIQRVNCSHEL